MQNVFCWWCGRKLARVMTGDNRGQISFKVLQTAGGNHVYVHHDCYKDAAQAQKLVTAASKEIEDLVHKGLHIPDRYEE
jgi:hypothetical protein